MSVQRHIVGTGTKSEFLAPLAGDWTPWTNPSPTVIEVSAADQTVTVDAAFSIEELQRVLGREGQCLPLLSPETSGRLLSGIPGTVGGLLAMNLPHGLSAQHGGPKEWLLQIEVLFDGQPAKAGAKVVKNVAGYDVHKVYVGSRGVLGPITRVTMRTWPVRALLKSSAVSVREWDGGYVWIKRTLPTEFDPALERAQGLLAHDRASCTLWTTVEPDHGNEGWIIGPRGEVWRDNVSTTLEQRLKGVFDPEGVWV